ncbi:MAG TPA: YCF48-related protein [Bacteroidia bacterium]|jgi:photosystem II stability/assembly factor-like uncharacterized protein|nr:YCF48-related protein [Bacteroidia bacterium]
MGIKKKILACYLFVFSCSLLLAQKIGFTKVIVDTNCSFRGLSVVDDKVAWLSGRNGVVGVTTDGSRTWNFITVKDCGKMDFRTIYAFNAKEAVIANTGSPALVLRTSNSGVTWDTVYMNKDSLAFIDGVDFWNEYEGVIYGDPVDGHIFIAKTEDGGQTWKELPKESRPLMNKGEASFAASGTGIRCYGKNNVMICTGGKVSRLLVSEDEGKNWRSVSTPIIQAEEGRGIFSVAINGDSNWVIVGGDFRHDTLKNKNAFYTTDTGKTWSAPVATTGGYRECVEFLTRKLVLTCGPDGTDVSFDGGVVWNPVADQKGFHVVRKARKGNLVIAAGKGKISIVLVERHLE